MKGPTFDLLRCSFCARSQKQVKKLIAGPGVYICDDDVARAEQNHRVPGPSEACAFCGKREQAWVHGRGSAIICDECVKLCLEIIEEETVITTDAQQIEVTASAETSVVAARVGPVEGARCPSCSAPLAESARTEIKDVRGADGAPGARVMFLYCSNCGSMIDDMMLPAED